MKKTLDKIKQFHRVSQNRIEKQYSCFLHNLLLNAKRITKNEGSDENDVNQVKFFINLEKVQNKFLQISHSFKLIQLTQQVNKYLRKQSSTQRYQIQMGNIPNQFKINLLDQLESGPVTYKLLRKIKNEQMARMNETTQQTVQQYKYLLASNYIDSILQENRIKYFNKLLSQLIQFAQRNNLDNILLIRQIKQNFNGLSANTRYLTIASYLSNNIPAPFIEDFIKSELHGTKYELSDLFGTKIDLKNLIMQRILQKKKEELPLQKVLPRLSFSHQLKLRFLLKDLTHKNAIKYINDLICERMLTFAENKNAIPWSPRLLKFIYHLNHEMQCTILTFFLNDFILKNEEFDLENRKMHIYVLLLLQLIKVHQKNFYQFDAAFEIYKVKTANYDYELDYIGLYILIQRHKLLEEEVCIQNLQEKPLQIISFNHLEKILNQILRMKKNQQQVYNTLFKKFYQKIKNENFLQSLTSLNLLIELGYSEILKETIEKAFEINSEEVFYKQLLELLKMQYYSEQMQQSSKVLGNVLLKLVSDRYLGFKPEEFEQIMFQVLKLEDSKQSLGEHYQENVFVEVQNYYVRNFIKFSAEFNKAMAKYYQHIATEQALSQIQQIQNKI